MFTKHEPSPPVEPVIRAVFFIVDTSVSLIGVLLFYLLYQNSIDNGISFRAIFVINLRHLIHHNDFTGTACTISIPLTIRKNQLPHGSCYS